MAWITPKTDWLPVDGVDNADFNRIEGDISWIADNPTANKMHLNTTGGEVFIGSTPSITGRADAQLEIHNAGTSHALFSTVMLQDPGVTTSENAWSGAGYNSAGTLTQMGSFYMRWDDTDSVTGYSVVGMHPNYAGGAAGPGAFEVFGDHGALFFAGSFATPPPNNQVWIHRTVGSPSLCGDTNGDFVLDANNSGGAQDLNLQAFNAGDIRIGLGGGDTIIGSGTGYGATCDISHSSGVTLRLDKTTGAFLQFSRLGVAGYALQDNSSGDLSFLSAGANDYLTLTTAGNMLPTTAPADSSWALTTTAMIIPRGVYSVVHAGDSVGTNYSQIQQFSTGVWRHLSDGDGSLGQGTQGGVIFSDGTNYRARMAGSAPTTGTMYYRQF